MSRILLAGDDFITADILAAAAQRHLPEAEVVHHRSGFPEEAFRSVDQVHEATGDVARLIEDLAGCEACIAHTQPFTRQVFDARRELRVVAVCRGGPVNVDMEAAADHGVSVTFVPGRNAVATAEHTVAMILAAARKIAQCHAEVVAGDWSARHYRYDEAAFELAGSAVGVIGFGAIGSRVAAVCEALGMSVVVFDPYLARDLPAGYHRVDALDDLLTASHVVTIHARQGPQTRGMIGRRELGLMPPGAILVNCARGGLLDYEALVDALESGHLGAAAVDVFPTEPIEPASRLLAAPRLTLTPHVAGASRQSAHVAADAAAADVARFLAGQRPRWVANG